MISLFYLTDVSYGGFATYTAHLLRALQAERQEVALYKVGRRLESKSRVFTHGVHYQNVSLEAAVHIALRTQAIITCCYWRSSPEGADALLAAGAALVLHDPTELTPELLAAIHKHRPRVIAIRRSNVELFARKQIERISYVPHPYVPISLPRAEAVNAISACRVDFDKYTHEIIAANKLLPTSHSVRVFGAVNRLYAFHKLAKLHPEWEEYYCGVFPKTEDAAVRLLSTAKFAVDLSRVAGDGGGTQYSFLEAWDARCQLVVHQDWLQPEGELVDGYNCTAVESPEHLALVLTQEPNPGIVRGGYATMLGHSPRDVIPLLLDALQ